MTTRITTENITDATIGTADLASSVPLNTQWQAVKTATFTAVAGEGYFVNSGSALTMNLPAGAAGATIVVADYARNFSTYNFTVSPNGLEKIGGVAENTTLDVDGQAATFVYVDATKGWVNVQNAENTEIGVPPFISATGGTITESGDFRIHTFTGDGCFVVTSLATQSPAPIYNIVSYVVAAAGGGSGGTINNIHTAGGGGGGGFREGKNAPVDSYTASPLNAPAGLTVSAATYPITVGGGGAGGDPTTRGSSGGQSIFSTITSAGGGGGGAIGSPGAPACRAGGPGGSGGGGSSQLAGPGGTGNTPPTSPAQGTNGAQGTDSPPDVRGGSGGGATVAGSGGSPPFVQGVGGTGATTHISGSPLGYSGGGGAGGTEAGPQAGGAASPCGSGAAGQSATGTFTGVNAINNRAGGGGGAAASPGGPATNTGGVGGSGVVIIRYKFQ